MCGSAFLRWPDASETLSIGKLVQIPSDVLEVLLLPLAIDLDRFKCLLDALAVLHEDQRSLLDKLFELDNLLFEQ